MDNARRIVNTVDVPVFADMDTGYGDAIMVHTTVKEYIRAGIAGAHLEDQTYPPKLGPRRRCVSIKEMVGKLQAAMDAKMELDPDFVIVARCDYAGIPGTTFEEVMERCLAYKERPMWTWSAPMYSHGKIIKRPSGGFPARCCLCLPTGTKPTRPYRSCRTREPLQRGIQASPPWQRFKGPGTSSTILKRGAPPVLTISW